MRRILLFGFTLGLGVLALNALPDLRRYFKITTM
jgi:hypothetical protein